jgi:penicillin-binding protein 1C
MTTAILRKLDAPKGFSNRKHHIAYKTGTSYGYRDAWTIAYTKQHTVAVWVGKPNNNIQIQRTGSNTSAPLAFEVLSTIEALLSPKHWKWSPYTIANATSTPIGLKYFEKTKKDLEKTFSFVYPQKNSRFMSAGCSDAVVEVLLKEGKAPYAWYIDKQSKAYTYEKESFYIPFKHGGHSIEVIDSTGTVITRNIWVNKPEC